MRSNKAHIVFYMGIAAAIGILIGSVLDYNKKPSFSLLSQRSDEYKIKRLLDYIQYDYVDEVNTDSLLDRAINQIMTNLDPHSVYIPQAELQSVQENMEGNFSGIGIQFRMIRDTVTVMNVIKDGPSEKAGLQAGDRILLKDQDTLYGKSYDSEYVMHFLKGETGTPLHLKVYRKKNEEYLDFDFDRGKVNLSSVPVYYMINEDLGYIKIERFARNTYEEFSEALQELLSQGMQKLVLDLRGNTGGYLDMANKIADEFLKDGKLIVFTKNKSGKIDKSFATSKGDFEEGKVYILINDQTASASEIVAGALQDNDKGTIVGRRSFGKGLVQQEMALGDGSAVRLTTARYYTPTGRSIQKPYTKNNETYFDDLHLRAVHGELLNKDSIHTNDSLKYTTPKGKIVYGGGGIIPDVFVPIDTTMFVPVIQPGRINSFIFDYVDTRRKELEKLDWNAFEQKVNAQDLLQAYLKEYPIKHTELLDKMDFGNYLKSLVARELFGETGFYRVFEKQDNMIQKVLELEQTQLE